MQSLRGLELPTPPRLLAAVEAERAAAIPRRRRRRRRFGGFAAGLAAACVLAVVLLGSLLTSSDEGGGRTATVVAASRLAERPATRSAPGAVPGEPTLLALDSAGIPFPDFREKFGWRATGWRRDDLDGHAARTVSYARNGQTVGYTILAGAPLSPPARARAVTREGSHLQVFREGRREIVTWLRDGRTCVISATGVGADELLALASWTGKGTVPF